MVAGSLAGPRESLVHLEDEGLDVLRVAAIYGANAAGKSNVLEALRFMSAAVELSHRRWSPDGAIPREPFLLDASTVLAPSLFEADFLVGEIRYQYGFRLDSQRILEEWLYAYPNRRRQVWFRRDAQAAEPFDFGKSLRGNNRTIASLTRENSLFLSAAAENNHDQLSPVHSWFVGHLVFNVHDYIFPTASLLPDRKPLLLDLLKLADLGIVDLEPREFPKEQKDLVAAVVTAFKEIPGTSTKTIPPLDRLRLVELKHLSASDPTGIALPFAKESQGTRTWLSLAGPLLDALELGAVFCVDELDRSLHPRLALEVVRIFEGPVRNPKNAQLIFNTHDTTLLGNLLDGPGLRRDQVWFVEKDVGGATHLYPLTDFKPRRDENLERGYLQGRFGAIPYIAPAALAEADDD